MKEDIPSNFVFLKVPSRNGRRATQPITWRPPSHPSPKMGEGEWRVGLEGETIKSYQQIPLWAQIRTSPFMGEAGGGDCPRRHRPSRHRARRVNTPDVKRRWVSVANGMLSAGGTTIGRGFQR